MRRLAIALMAAGFAGGAMAEITGPQGRWLAEDIGGRGVIDRLQSVIVLDEGGRITGNAGCNAIAGRAEISGDTIRIGPLAVTRKLCTPAIMDQEARLITALGQAQAWQIDRARHKLILTGEEGRPVAIFAEHDERVRSR